MDLPAPAVGLPRKISVVGFLDHSEDTATRYTIQMEFGEGSSLAIRTVLKRYSDFKELHTKLLVKFADQLNEFRFPTKSVFQTRAESTKERRKQGFDEFVKLVLSLSPVPYHVYDFLGLEDGPPPSPAEKVPPGLVGNESPEPARPMTPEVQFQPQPQVQPLPLPLPESGPHSEVQLPPTQPRPNGPRASSFTSLLASSFTLVSVLAAAIISSPLLALKLNLRPSTLTSASSTALVSLSWLLSWPLEDLAKVTLSVCAFSLSLTLLRLMASQPKR